MRLPKILVLTVGETETDALPPFCSSAAAELAERGGALPLAPAPAPAPLGSLGWVLALVLVLVLVLVPVLGGSRKAKAPSTITLK